MLLEVLRQPYVFALATSLLTAALAYAYSRITDPAGTVSVRVFFKTLAAGMLAGLALTYVSAPRAARPIAMEPFDAVSAAMNPAAPMGLGI